MILQGDTNCANEIDDWFPKSRQCPYVRASKHNRHRCALSLGRLLKAASVAEALIGALDATNANWLLPMFTVNRRAIICSEVSIACPWRVSLSPTSRDTDRHGDQRSAGDTPPV